MEMRSGVQEKEPSWRHTVRRLGNFTQTVPINGERRDPRTEPQACPPFRGWRGEKGLHEDAARSACEVGGRRHCSLTWRRRRVKRPEEILCEKFC